MNFGFLKHFPAFEEYIFGVKSLIPKIALQLDGNWEPSLPTYECQADIYETCGCPIWGGQNQVETYCKRLYGKDYNFSERFNCALLQIRCPGTNPQRAYENIRKYGLIDAELFPMPDTHEEFLNKKRITSKHREAGQKWLKRNAFMHDWLWDVRPANYLDIIKEALIYSPIAASVTAWYQDADGRYVDVGRPNNHWCLIYRIDAEGIHVFDSYDNSKKILPHSHSIEMAKRIYIAPLDNSNGIHYIDVLKKIISNLTAILKR